jgi:hypothetical protein
MSELLIIKVGSEYLRFAADDYLLCPLNKASVFSLAQAEEAKMRFHKLSEAGLAAELMKLTIIEEPYTE